MDGQNKEPQGESLGPAQGNYLNCAISIIPQNVVESQDPLAIIKEWMAQVRAGPADWTDLVAWAHRPEIEALVQKYTGAGEGAA